MERRAFPVIQHGRTLKGYAALFGVEAPIADFVEVVQPGAFSRSLAGPAAASIRAIYEHDNAALLGRVGAGTLRLHEDDHGLAFELDLPDTTLGRDVAELVKRGDLGGCSFGFVPKQEEWDGTTRNLVDVDLYEITLTATPAYPETSVNLRSRLGDNPVMLSLARKYLEACGL
ncbi:TPA: HK97 family phage prohead protease [Pseudomonas aeruginosa]|nr:HK97 family phage prohead protease [Pseudomonas aeruginosa]HCE0990995.1 HK97 family phage prohead protease [Pseudomonas aeruginosa]HCE3943029.1 HK97 family phage prohead protease [Pseudomonas aeruginosa]